MKSTKDAPQAQTQDTKGRRIRRIELSSRARQRRIRIEHVRELQGAAR